MLNQIEQSFFNLCDESSCIITIPLDIKTKDTIVSLGIDINIEDFENNYWGRGYGEGYCYQICRL